MRHPLTARARCFGVVAVLSIAAPAAAQDASLADLAQLLALEDRRSYDGLTLERAAQHPDTLVRVRAAMAMGRIGDRAAVPVLLRLLADRDTAVRVEAVFALGELGDRRAAPELVRLVETFPAQAGGALVGEVVTALAKIGGADADGALDRLLERHPPDGPGADGATAAALLEAWRLGDTSAVARRLPGYIRQARGDWRRNATYSAARLRVARAGAALLEAASDSEPLTRAHATRGLIAAVADSSGLAREAFIGRLRVLLDDADAQVRITALRSLGTFADSTLASLAAAKLLDRDLNAQIQAAQTLGQLGGARAATALAERLAAAASWGLRRALLLALVRLAPPRALELSRDWRADPDWRWRALHAEILGATGTPARAGLVALLDDADVRVVSAALNGLEQVTQAGDTAAVGLARARLEHPDVVIRANAIGLIGRERDPRWIPDLVAAYRRAERDELNDARLAAVNALGDLARTGEAARQQVETRFLDAVPRSADYLVRRALADRFGAQAHARRWGPVLPIETGRAPEDYRALARRWILRSVPAPSRVTIETERGSVVIELFGYEAPVTVDNFVRLTERRFFDNGRWHRVVPNFVVQDGDPRGDGSTGSATPIRDEINRRRYDRGSVGMALSGPDTGTSQFFICHSPQPHLDGGYTVFGQIVTGWDVLDQIVQGDRIRRIFLR